MFYSHSEMQFHIGKNILGQNSDIVILLIRPWYGPLLPSTSSEPPGTSFYILIFFGWNGLQNNFPCLSKITDKLKMREMSLVFIFIILYSVEIFDSNIELSISVCWLQDATIDCEGNGKHHCSDNNSQIASEQHCGRFWKNGWNWSRNCSFERKLSMWLRAFAGPSDWVSIFDMWLQQQDMTVDEISRWRFGIFSWDVGQRPLSIRETSKRLHYFDGSICEIFEIQQHCPDISTNFRFIVANTVLMQLKETREVELFSRKNYDINVYNEAWISVL